MESETVASRPTRLRPLILILVLSAVALSRLFLFQDIAHTLRLPCTGLIVAVTLLLVGIWLLASMTLRMPMRLAGVGGCVLMLIAAGFSIRAITRSAAFTDGRTPKPDEDLSRFSVPSPYARPAELARASPQDFPQFLGPERHNIVRGVHLGRDWSAHPPKQLWRHPIGIGWSSFVVAGDYAVTQEQRAGDEMTVCYELTTGLPRWLHANHVRFAQTQGGDGPRATPTIAGGRVFAMGATGILDCLDGATGHAIWTHNVLEDARANNLGWGKTCSPLVTDDLVIVTGGEGRGPSLLAYRRDTGDRAWSADGDDRCSYSSPALATIAGATQILQVNAASVTAHDPADGRVIWRYPWAGDTIKISQPVLLDGDRIFLSAGYGVGCVLLQSNASGAAPRADVVWTSRQLKTKFSNVAVYNGFVYGLDDEVLTCLDLSTGKRRWRDGDYGYGQILLVDDLLLVQAESGDVALVEATPAAYNELARFSALSERTWCNPVLSGHKLLVRNDREAACYELP